MSVQNVVAEMTRTFKQQVQVKDQELRKCQEDNLSLSNLSQELRSKCEELDHINRENKLKIEELSERLQESGAQLRQDVGSVEDLSKLVEAELELSSELDNTLLSQVVTGLGLTCAGWREGSGLGRLPRPVLRRGPPMWQVRSRSPS